MWRRFGTLKSPIFIGGGESSSAYINYDDEKDRFLRNVETLKFIHRWITQRKGYNIEIIFLSNNPCLHKHNCFWSVARYRPFCPSCNKQHGDEEEYADQKHFSLKRDPKNFQSVSQYAIRKFRTCCMDWMVKLLTITSRFSPLNLYTKFGLCKTMDWNTYKIDID